MCILEQTSAPIAVYPEIQDLRDEHVITVIFQPGFASQANHQVLKLKHVLPIQESNQYCYSSTTMTYNTK